MKLKDWLLKKYLPSWAGLEYGDAPGGGQRGVSSLLEAAQRRVRELEAENRQLRAYINGVERGLRAKQPEIRIERSDGG